MTDPNNAPNRMDNATVLLLADDLRMVYGARAALHGLSFALLAGRVLGFLGPNGAGKTTSIRILTTMMEPTSGHFFVDGISSEHQTEIRRRIGVLPENLGFPKSTTALEYLVFFSQMYGRTATQAHATAWDLLEEVGLKNRAKSLIGSYSRGMKQRLGIARALVNDPQVVFLDEPTLGLDPRGQQELLTLIRQVAQERNAGVVLSSHMLSEIEGICDDVVILNAGKVVMKGPVLDVIGGNQQNAARIQVAADRMADAESVLKTVSDVAKVSAITGRLGWLKAELSTAANGALTDVPQHRNSILAALVEANIPVQAYEAAGGRLQDVFLQVTDEAIK